MSAEQLGRSTGRIFDPNAHFGALFGDLEWLMVELDARYATEIDEFLAFKTRS